MGAGGGLGGGLPHKAQNKHMQNSKPPTLGRPCRARRPPCEGPPPRNPPCQKPPSLSSYPTHLVGLAGHRVHHVEQVLGVGQVVAGVDDGLSGWVGVWEMIGRFVGGLEGLRGVVDGLGREGGLGNGLLPAR